MKRLVEGDEFVLCSVRELQESLLEILKEIDRVCRKHDIRYSLFAGTALGAVRHQGFIPWDDDLDIMMIRPEYDRFLAAAKEEMDSEKFYVQEEYSSHWPMHYSKIRMNGTTFLERYIPNDRKMHQGIFVDVFPCDYLSNSMIIQKLQYFAAKVVIAKNLSKRGYRTGSFAKKIFMAFSKVLPHALFNGVAKNEGASDSELLHSFFGGSSSFSKSIYPRCSMVDTDLVPFEGCSFPLSKGYDAVLTIQYGDYMTPPSAEEIEKKRHGVVVDLDKSYEEYASLQRTLCFSDYAGSIR